MVCWLSCVASFLSSSYLSDDCQPVSDSRPRRLRSSDSLTCVVRRAHNTYGDRCFATAGPRIWNSLPAELQQCDSLMQFKRCLKTFLFGSWDYGTLWLCVNRRRIEIVLLTYLLFSAEKWDVMLWFRTWLRDWYTEDNTDGSVPAVGHGADRAAVQVCVPGGQALHGHRTATRRRTGSAKSIPA